jgi:hypothetical protein
VKREQVRVRAARQDVDLAAQLALAPADCQPFDGERASRVRQRGQRVSTVDDARATAANDACRAEGSCGSLELGEREGERLNGRGQRGQCQRS